MKTSILFLSALLASGIAFADVQQSGEPLALNESQMDSVTAGQIIWANAFAEAQAWSYDNFYAYAYAETFSDEWTVSATSHSASYAE